MSNIFKFTTNAPVDYRGQDTRVINLDHHPQSQARVTISQVSEGAGWRIMLTQMQALQLLGVLQTFVSTGRVAINDDGLMGFNEGDSIKVALCRADGSWETLGPFKLSSKGYEHLIFGQDVFEELSNQKPRPVVTALIVPDLPVVEASFGVLDNG